MPRIEIDDLDTTDHDPRPDFHSARLHAEPVELRHAAEMVQVLRDPLVFEYVSGDPPSLEALERRYAFLAGGSSPDGTQQWLTWILRQSEPPRAAVGFTQASIEEPLHFHVAYVIGKDHQRHGYAREATAAMIDTVFECYRVERAIIEVDTRNAPSIRLAEALGFRLVDTQPTGAHSAACAILDHIFELTRDEWNAR